MGKKIISALVLVAMLGSLVACQGNRNPDDETSTVSNNSTVDFSGSEPTVSEGVSTQPSATEGNNSETDATTRGQTNPGSKGPGNSTTTIKPPTANITPPTQPTVEKSKLESKDYGGKTFKFLYWYSPDDVVKRKVAAFNEAHNANLTLDIVPAEMNETVAKSIASGAPYDVIANHGRYFPQTIFANLYEPLEGQIAKQDMYDTSKPDRWGLSQAVCDSFAWNGHYYALGSAKSVYPYVLYYNKKMFKEAGLEDPWELYQKGQWTWEKFLEMAYMVTDISNSKFFFHNDELMNWLCLNTVSGITLKDGVLTETMTSADFVSAVTQFQQNFLGENPISMFNSGGDPFKSGRAYTSMQVTDAYKQLANNVRTSSAFSRKVENLGTVPMPYAPLNKDKKYPGHAPQGYSATKGCSDPSVAACYALFESRYTDVKTSGYQLPVEVRNEIDKLFATNGYLPYVGFKNSSGYGYSNIVNEKIAHEVAGGADVNATINNYRNEVNRLIEETLDRASELK